MTAKQEFYQMCLERVPSEEDVRLFARRRPSVQWRKLGNSNVQVRFNQHESWIDVSTFSELYHNKVVKQLNDLLLATSNIVSGDDLWMLLTQELKQNISQRVLNDAKQEGRSVDREAFSRAVAKYNELVNRYNALLAQYNKLKEADADHRSALYQLTGRREYIANQDS